MLFAPDKVTETVRETEDIISGHLTWLGSLGMKCNSSKTEAVIFGHNAQRCSLNINGNQVEIKDTIKILGVTYEKNLKWSTHVATVIRKANSFSYSIRQLNHLLPRGLHRQVIQAHFLSHIAFALPVWGGCLSQFDVNRINKILFKIMRIHCFDHQRRKTNRELCEQAQMRNFTSMRIVGDAVMLHRLCRDPENSYLTTRLIEQSSFSLRMPERILFFDYSARRIGGTSFVNRAKRISELIPFPWPDLSYHAFKTRMKKQTPLLIG